MSKPGDRTKKKKFRRKISKKSKVFYTREKTSKHHCAICKGVLHGTPHGKTRAKVRKLSKTERRPSVPFGGVLCTKCRTSVFEEATKVSAGSKKIEDIDLKKKNYVEITVKKL